MVSSFKSYTDLSDLYENTLYTTPAEKDEILKDKSRVAAIFATNFFGMLGLINALQPGQKKTVLNFLRKDKRVQVANIDDSNHDISLSLKLAHDADFFINKAMTVEISKFLFKLKSGQITDIDSAVVAKWANGLKPDFVFSLKDPYVRTAFIDFRDNGGTTVDISRLAVTFKRRINKLNDGGDFKRFAKRFFGLTERQIGQPATTTPTATAAAATTAAVAAPAKLSYYQRQKLKKQQAAQAAQAAPAQQTPADDAALKAQVDAENAAGKKRDAKTISGESINKMIEGVLTQVPRSVSPGTLDRVVDIMVNNANPDPDLKTRYKDLARMLAQEIYNPLIELFTAQRVNFDDVLAVRKILLDVKKQYIAEFDAPYNGVHSFEKLLDMLVARMTATSTNEFILRAMISQNLLGYQPNKNAVRFLMGDQPNYVFTTLERIIKATTGNRSLIELYYQLINGIDPKDASGFDKFKSQVLANVMSYLIPAKGSANIVGGWRGYSDNYVTAGLTFIRLKKLKFSYLMSLFSPYSRKEMAANFIIRYLVTGYDTFGETYDIEYSSDNLDYLRQIVVEYYETVMASIRDTTSQGVLGQVLYDLHAYNFSLPDMKGPLAEFLRTEIVADLYKTPLEETNLVTFVPSNSYKLSYVLKMLDVDFDKMKKVNLNNSRLTLIGIESQGPDNFTVDEIAGALLVAAGNAIGSSTVRETRRLITKVGAEKADKLVQALLVHVAANPSPFNNKLSSEPIARMIADASSETVVKLMTIARDNKMNMMMGPDLYKALGKSDKQFYVDTITGILQDTIDTPVEDYVNEIVENLPPHVVQKMRGNLVGAQVLIDEINKGEIKPFDKIDNQRVKKIFQYNDIDMTALLRGVTEKKKKSETYPEYFKRAKQQISKAALLEKEKVSPDDKADKKQINRIMIQRDHAGKHGDVYPKILKVYNASLEYPEFEQFRKNNFGDGTVVPAYHGTGGIAAGMILRYGFKVIKSSDPSVTGRMLGDGIYFSNKIDKVMQYVSNSGYSRSHGQKGYIMEMDINLGIKPRDYQAAGLGNDSIRSPEWCVRDPKAQTRIVKVYEVELNSRRNVDEFLKEDYNSIKSFKQHLKEQTLAPTSANMTGFIFRDGMIPIINREFDGEYTAVDFEEALKDKLITEDMFEVTGQGPMIVFRNTDEQTIVDLRYNWQLSGPDLDLYVRLFQEKMYTE